MNKPALRWLLRFLITAYLLSMAGWAWETGTRLRDAAWIESRDLRQENNIASGYKWGTMVLRAAERSAGSKAASQPATRPLTFGDLVHGEDQLYQDVLMGRLATGDFDLDYPPLRLMAMALWARGVEHRVPGIDGWPGSWKRTYSASHNPADLADEDLARPMLLANTLATAASAICVFFLVWIWTHRGGRPRLPGPARRLIPWKPVPITRINGLLLFAVTTSAFFYAIAIAERPTPPAPPAVAFAGRPILMLSPKPSAVITASIDRQGTIDARWRVDWGATPRYGHSTDWQTSLDEDGSVILTDLPPDTVIHYRITAKNDHGWIHSADASFNTAAALAPLPPRDWYGSVWLSWPQWTAIGLLFLTMTLSLQWLPPLHRGWAAGMVAALLLWFDPAVILDTHLWPQWDVWALAPFLLATLLATLNAWFLAGMVLGAGIMLKGQLLLAIPILALWPLFSRRWIAAARLLIGFALAAALVLSPWLVLGNAPIVWSVGPLRWIAGVLFAAAIAAALSLYRRPLWQGKLPVFDLTVLAASLLVGIVVITLLILTHWPPDSELPRIAGLFLLLAVSLPPWFMPRKSLPLWFALILTASLWISPYLFHGDWSWKSVGFDYGTVKHADMSIDNGNLPQILQTRFGWNVYDHALTLRFPNIFWDIPPLTLDIRQTLIGVYVVLLILCGAAAAIQSRRNHPHFLAALAALWTLMPNVLCQMQARYQMWAAAVSCLVIGLSPGLSLLHVVICLLAGGMIAAQLLMLDPTRSPRILEAVRQWKPDEGWIILLIGLIFLYVSLVPGRRPPPPEMLIDESKTA